MDLFKECIPGARASIFRFEGLQDYSGQDPKMLEEYLKTGYVPDPANSKWWMLIRDKNEKGIVTHRVRLVVRPLNVYTEMESAYLKKAAEFSGEDIRIIEEDEFKKISMNLPDFYLIDDTYLFLMEYDEKGKYIKSEFMRGEKVDGYIGHKNELLGHSSEI